MILFNFISSLFFEALVTAGIVLALFTYATRELHPASGSPGEGETEAGFFFFFHFCLIPLVSEGITGPFMIEGGRWLTGRCPRRLRRQRAEARRTEGATSGGIVFGLFLFTYFKSAGGRLARLPA